MRRTAAVISTLAVLALLPASLQAQTYDDLAGGWIVTNWTWAEGDMDDSPQRGLFLFTALVHICMIVFVVHRLWQRDIAPSEEHISFADAMRVGLTVSSVDPISHDDEEPKSAE